MQRGDGAIVHAEVRITHHLGGQAHVRGLVTAGLGQFHVYFQSEAVTKQVGENGINGFTAQVLYPKEVMALLGYPVRGMHQQYIRF